VEREDRNHPLSLEQALAMIAREGRLIQNTQSGRAAVLMPHTAITLEDGAVQERVRIVRPLAARAMSREEFDLGHWRSVDREGFAALWRDELSTIPATSKSRFHLVTGLLLPIWNLLPEENPRVYRFQTVDGERVIGRLIPEGSLAGLTRAIDFTCSPADALTLLEAGETIALPGGRSLARARVMHAERYELTGFTAAEIPLLKSMGLMAEITQWRTRLFIPSGDPSLTLPVLERVMAYAVPAALAA
jgi:hypothetical protein